MSHKAPALSSLSSLCEISREHHQIVSRGPFQTKHPRPGSLTWIGVLEGGEEVPRFCYAGSTEGPCACPASPRRPVCGHGLGRIQGLLIFLVQTISAWKMLATKFGLWVPLNQVLGSPSPGGQADRALHQKRADPLNPGC